MQHRIKALSVHSEKLQRVLNSGDIVTEDMFPTGHFAELIADGAIEAFEETEIQHTVTQETLDLNPELAERGVKVGDLISFVPESGLSGDEKAEILKAAAEARAADEGDDKTTTKTGRAKKA